ncbi:MAG: carboxylesterase family protein [Oscillospiraceae bacterium]|nr:carboxylesterase family protein [Oscillospiraceae bacterium]
MKDVILTPCGPIRGVQSRNPGVTAYKGIRYATAQRWKHPEIVTHWEGVYEADHYGHCSYQPRAFYNEEENLKKIFYYHEFRKGETYTYSEDCLFLNVFTPDTARPGDDLPVLLYIHGGGFTGGCGHEKHFDEPVWPQKGVIAVTINYRLGPMGFVSLPELKEEAGACGNYGLYDQLCAIRWVRENIAAFGGDPEAITIMGQSAGAMSVQQHCLSPLSEGMFRGAVMSSGGGVSGLMKTRPAESSYDFWKLVMEKAGCNSLAAFRALPAEQLFAAWDAAKKEGKGGAMSCSPVIDGRLVVASPEAHDIPYMAGVTSEDMMPPILHGMAKSWCQGREKPSYCWHFDRQLPGDDCGAWHSADLWYWFGTVDNGWRPMEQKDRALSEEMVRYLCNFAKTGDPNRGDQVALWTPAQSAGKQVLRMGEKPTAMGKLSMLKLIHTMLTNKAVGE